MDIHRYTCRLKNNQPCNIECIPNMRFINTFIKDLAWLLLVFVGINITAIV